MKTIFDKNNINGTKRVAEIMSNKKYNLVYGGDYIGLMGHISRAMKKNGRKIFGVCINNMYNRRLLANYCDEITVVKNLEERKMTMINSADIIVCLPGGIGTMNELMDVLVMIHLKIISKKKIILVNMDNFFSNLIHLLTDLKKKNFLKEDLDDMFTVIDDVNDLEKLI